MSLALAEDFKTVNGKEYKNATVIRAEPDGIAIKISDGLVKIPFTELSKEVQERFHYDPQTPLSSMLRFKPKWLAPMPQCHKHLAQHHRLMRWINASGVRRRQPLVPLLCRRQRPQPHQAASASCILSHPTKKTRRRAQTLQG